MNAKFLLLLVLALAATNSTAADAVTDCDRLAAHPSDPDKLGAGAPSKTIDLPVAEAACRRVIADDPSNIRAHYQLGRVLFYQHKTDAALPELEKAASAGYRQAIFVLGFVNYDGKQLPRNDCRAAGLWQRSIALDHPWTGYYLVKGYLDGRFDACGVKLSEKQLQDYLDLARANISVASSAGRVEALEEQLHAGKTGREAESSRPQPQVTVTPFDPARYSQQVTECDRLASHPDDPYKVAEGREKREIDLPRAVAACRGAVAKDPENPRLNYLLGRVLGYSGLGDQAIPYRQRATDADYPQALFVIGYITLFGMNKQPQDNCRAGELLRRSAQQGRLAGQFGFPRYALQGRFAGCDVVVDIAEMRGFVAAGRAQAGGDYYKTLLADLLDEALTARSASAGPE
ncbi:MAG: hypothetical protein R3E77_15540 [Steroidobacteraceae bacterium]